MKLIPLTQGKFVMVDDDDYNCLNQFKWRYSNGYAVRAEYFNRKQTSIHMHRVIMNVNDSNFFIDHIDGDKSNNQKSNLRIANKSQNGCNRGKTKNNKSGYKGVFWHKDRNKWGAEIRVNGKKTFLGYFTDKILAAKVYNEAAVKYHGEFAYLNIMSEDSI